MTRQPEPDIFIGLGAAKAGTTWLHDYLSKHPQVHLRRQKEIIFFGRQDGPLATTVKKRNLLLRANAMRGLQTRGFNIPNFELLRDMVEWDEYLATPDPMDARYPEYLRLRHELHADVRICGDISPQYAGMSLQSFEQINRIVPDARYVYLVREPVSRFWSHCNHFIREDILRESRNNDAPLPGSVARMTTQEVAECAIDGDRRLRARLARHSDYSGTLEKLLSVVDRNRLYLGFYENLTDERQLSELCAFLGIDYMPGNKDRQVNVGDRENLPTQVREKATDLYRKDSEAVRNAAMSGLPEAWKACVHSENGASV